LVCKVLGGLGVVFTERAYRKVVEVLLGTRRPDPVTGQLPGERFYGRRKMTHWLRRQGFQVSFCQVDRLMRQQCLQGLRRGRVRTTTIRSDEHTPAEDLVRRNFTAAVPNQRGSADLTYVSTWSGWCWRLDHRQAEGCKPEQVRDALASKVKTLPESLRLSLTWDQGPEMRDWKQVSVDADIDIYFCDPHSPWQLALAARHQRELQRPAAPILSEGHRPGRAQ